MKILNKFIWSKTEPKNKNDIWFDGSVFNLYRNDTWEAFTIPIGAAEKVAEVIKDALNVFQSKLIAGKGINIKDSVISTTTLFNIVNNLPLEGKEDTIYLVLNSEQDTNRFKEYVWINNTWESLGEFKADVDLSNYITKQVFNSALTDKADRSELTELSAEVSGLSEGIALRNVGAEDTDESVEEPDLPTPTPSGSKEWKCVYDGRPEVGVDVLNIETYSNGTPLKAQEAIVQILIDTQADSNKNGYVYIKSTTNKTIWNAFGIIDFQNNSASADNKFLQQIHFKASPIMYMVAEIYNKMQGAVNSNVEIKAGIGSKGPQVYEDITLIRLVVNGALTYPPHIKIFVR